MATTTFEALGSDPGLEFGQQRSLAGSAHTASRTDTEVAVAVEAPTLDAQHRETSISDVPSADLFVEELEQELRKAQADPGNFTQWTAVEKLLDKTEDILVIRQVYDSLLAEFPLCYGYWKKYADAEHKYSSTEWAVSVFERGSAAVPYSPDLWGYFTTYKQKIGADASSIRELFEHGLAYVGTDYMAHGLWDKYIKFESDQENYSAISKLYLRILGSPLKEVDRYFVSLKEFVDERSAAEVMTDDEKSSILEHLNQAKSSTEQAINADALQTADNTAGGPALENGDAVMTDSVTAAKATGVAEMQEPETSYSEAEIKAHWLSGVQAMYEGTKEELVRRRVFEDAIKRPYFHVKPLDSAQLTAWSDYIDYVLKTEDAGLIVRLFERCLVACASYPEFWIRYVRYLESQDAGGAESTLQRPQHIFCKRNASFQLFAARFQEKNGNVDAARETYKLVLTQLAPGLLEAVVQAANFERRQQQKVAACKIYEEALTAKAEGKESAEEAVRAAGVAMMYAHFLQLDCGDTDAARAIFQAALLRSPAACLLWEAAIHFEETCLQDGRIERVLGLYERATADPKDGGEELGLSLEEKEHLSSRHIDFADRHAAPAVVEKLASAHALRFPKYGSRTASRKRAADAAAEEPAGKKAATEAQTYAAYADPGVSAAGYYPAAASGAAYGYGQYYQYPQQQYSGYSYPGVSREGEP